MFAPQDSDGDKSEDNLVVDVSNEVSEKLPFLPKHCQSVGPSGGGGVGTGTGTVHVVAGFYEFTNQLILFSQ